MAALPKIDKILYEDFLPSNNEKIFYRPFTVKEEKILLTAQQSTDFKQGILALKQILTNCVQNYDIDKISIFDAEYLLTKIRAKSVDEIVEISIKDSTDLKDTPLVVNLSDIKITKYENHTNLVKLNDDYTLKLKYPNLDTLALMVDPDLSESEISYLVLMNCLDKLISEDSVYNFDDYTDTEIEAFLDDLDKNTLKQINTFFETSPKMRHEIKYKNSLGEDKVFVIEGTRSFFM